MTALLEQAPELPPVGFERACLQFGVLNDSEIWVSWVCRANVKTMLSLQLKWQVLSLAKTDPKTDSRNWPSENVTLVALMLGSAKNYSQKGLFWDPVKSNKLHRKLYQLTLWCQSLHCDGKILENDIQSVKSCAK